MSRILLNILLFCAAAATTPGQASHPPTAAAEPPVVHYRIVNVGGVGVFYREAGPVDAPVVLLLHGFPTSSHMYRDLIPALAARYHVIAPDLPAFGASDQPSPDSFEYSFENLTRVVDDFARKLGLSSYVLYVMDYGAPVGFRLAAWHPCPVLPGGETTSLPPLRLARSRRRPYQSQSQAGIFGQPSY